MVKFRKSRVWNKDSERSIIVSGNTIISMEQCRISRGKPVCKETARAVSIQYGRVTDGHTDRQTDMT